MVEISYWLIQSLNRRAQHFILYYTVNLTDTPSEGLGSSHALEDTYYMYVLCHKFLLSQTCKFSKHIVPVSGQLLGGREFSITRGASLAIFVYCRILSTDIILFSALQMFHITEACKTFRLIPYVTAKPAMPIEEKENP